MPQKGSATASQSTLETGASPKPASRSQDSPEKERSSQLSLSPDARRAETALRAGHTATAIRLARKAIAKNKNDAGARLVLGHAYAKKLWYSDALYEYSRALALDPSLRTDAIVQTNAIAALTQKRTLRRAKAFILEQLGTEALPALTWAARESRDEDIRRYAAELVGRLGGEARGGGVR